MYETRLMVDLQKGLVADRRLDGIQVEQPHIRSRGNLVHENHRRGGGQWIESLHGRFFHGAVRIHDVRIGKFAKDSVTLG